MTLVFLVLSIFFGFAYASGKVLSYIETREHLEVFFKIGVDEQKVFEIKKALEDTGEVAYITYTSPDEANEYLRKKHSDNPLILGVSKPEFLPASLAIRAKKIDYVSDLNNKLIELDSSGELIDTIGFNEDSTNLLKDLLFWVRLAGVIIFIVLVVVIFLVSLITVEMSINQRNEEISIMQLVGGGQWYIRAPFIVQGMIYGIAGALIASSFLLIVGTILYFVKDQSPTLSFITNFFGDLDWPTLTIPRVLLLLAAEMLLGAFIGAGNSFIAVRRNLR
jgi:cell division transport system permease protein